MDLNSADFFFIGLICLLILVKLIDQRSIYHLSFPLVGFLLGATKTHSELP